MKKIFLAAILLLSLSPAILYAQKKCIGGSTWSILKQDCIQPYVIGINMQDLHPQGQTKYQASVIFSDDKKKAEVFLYGQKGNGGVILKYKKKTGTWEKGNMVLATGKGELMYYNLTIDGVMKYMQKL